MKYVIGICVVAIVVCITVFWKWEKSQGKGNTETFMKALKSGNIMGRKGNDELMIQMKMFPAESIADDTKFVEITDSKVLAHVNNLVPGFLQIGNTVNNAVKAAQSNGEVLYQVIIPAGTQLTNSKEISGAVRGFYRVGNKIQGQANLVAVEAQKGTEVLANTVASAMNVASMVVGQYYMAQINTELGQISEGISKISDFLDNEYRSRVFGLVSHIKTIASFQIEIIENHELRTSKIHQLDGLEEECTKLLGQANLTLADFAKKKELNFAEYEKELKEAQNWFMYQKTLLDVLYKISDLRYTLHLGEVSRDQCVALLPTYIKQVEDSQTRLTDWHKDIAERLNIDTTEIRRKREGIDGFIHFLPGLIKEEWAFKPIDKKTVNMIDEQVSGNVESHKDSSDLYKDDVQLIVKDGKIYYLPVDVIESNA